MNVSNLKLYVKMSFYSFFQLKSILRSLRAGQKVSYNILQNAHRLEKRTYQCKSQTVLGMGEGGKTCFFIRRRVIRKWKLICSKDRVCCFEAIH